VLQLMNRSLNLVTNIIPPLVLVIGLAVIVHVLNRYEEAYRRIGRQREALIEAVAHLVHPCFLTSLTTAIGFASLAISRIKPIRETGLLAAFGVMMAFVISIALAPAILSRLKPPVGRERRSPRHDAVDRVLQACARLVVRRPRLVLVVSFVTTGLAIVGMTQLTVETNLIEYFKPESRIRSSFRFLQEHISGANSLEFFLEADRDEAMIEPEVLRAVEALQREMEKSPRVTSTQSLADLVKLLNRALHGDDEAFFRIPDTREEVAQLLLLLSMSDDRGGLDHFTDLNYRHGRIAARMTTVPSQVLRGWLDHFNAFADETFPDYVHAAATGEVVLYVNMERELVAGQLKGFAIAIIIIIACVVLVFWSWRVGAYSMYPNIMPVAMTLGLMGLARIPINLATCMIPSIAIGIAVDDTIHFLARFRAEYRAQQQPDIAAAIHVTLATTGRAMVITSVVLFGGFLVLLASQFQPNLYFGALTALTMVWALLADLLTVPALLVVLRPRRF
ncbi:MAG: MMPL family transporter, partial [Candidatus Lernaella stagnicola]|nr:MMPL family transporter [Candidatus Lernaella stagnicola]